MEKTERQRCREYAFLLLKFRLRSEKELSQRLKRKKFSPEAIRDTLLFLQEKDFINDRNFARAWISERLRKPLGLRRLAQELKLKGVDEQIIESEISLLKEDYPEKEIIESLVKQRLKKYRGLNRQKSKRRAYAYLLRRGFSPGTVIDALDKI